MRLVLIIPTLASAIGLSQPDCVPGILHVPIAKNHVLSPIVAGRQFCQQIDREQIIQVVVPAAGFWFAVPRRNHIARNFDLVLSQITAGAVAPVEAAIKPQAGAGSRVVNPPSRAARLP